MGRERRLTAGHGVLWLVAAILVGCVASQSYATDFGCEVGYQVLKTRVLSSGAPDEQWAAAHHTAPTFGTLSAVLVGLPTQENERFARISNAPKRKIGDRVYVAMYPLAGDTVASATSAREIVSVIRDELRASLSITLLGDEDMELAERIRRANVAAGLDPDRAPASDVNVYLRIVRNQSKDSNVLEVTIRSNYLPARYRLEQILNEEPEAEQVRRFARRIRSIIVDTIGPTLPTNRNI